MVKMSYVDKCEECGKPFKARHYSWFVCVTCHYVIDKKEVIERIKSNEELE